MRSPKRRLALVLSGLLLSPSPTQATPELRQELTKIAANVAKLLNGRNETAIAIGEFTGPANLPTSSGPAIVV